MNLNETSNNLLNIKSDINNSLNKNTNSFNSFSFKSGLTGQNHLLNFNTNIGTETNNYKVWAQNLYKESLTKYNMCFKQISKIVPNNVGYLQGRVKDIISIKNAIERKISRGHQLNSATDAKNSIYDIIGTRIILNNGNRKEVSSVVRRLVIANRNNEISIDKVINFHGEGCRPYLTQTHINIIKASSGNKQPVIIANEDKCLSPLGFTGALFCITNQDGIKMEFQIVGSKVHEIADCQHILYDIHIGKTACKEIPELEELITPLQYCICSFSANEKENYKLYFNNKFKQAREIEASSSNTQVSKLPSNLNKIFEIDNLKKLNYNYNKLKNKYISQKQVQRSLINPAFN